ncbi:unnamed protein product [Schistosoma intercalatum]|nr:unnamed protein product [Schistosoma intercalatum]
MSYYKNVAVELLDVLEEYFQLIEYALDKSIRFNISLQPHKDAPIPLNNMIILQIYMHLLKLSSLLSLIFILLVSSTNLSYPKNSVKSLLPRQNIISPEDHLIEIISNNSINYGCDFNQLQFCSYEHSSDWSFQLSLTEFALKMKEAAETAAKVVQNFQEKLSQNNNTNNTTRIQAKISSNQYGNFPSIIIPTVNYFPCSTNHNQYSYIKLPIHWPKYFITHQPIIPIDVTISNSTCLQLRIQFLSNNHNEDKDNRLDSQIVLSLGSNKQTIRNVFNIEESYANVYHEDYNDDDDHLRENSETSSHTSSPPLSKQSDHWIAIDSIQLLSIYSTNNVCIDDILLYTHQNRQFLKSTCQNKLIWISNNKQSNHSRQILYLNSNGYPILLNRTNSSSLSSQSNHHHHHKKKDRNNFILQSFKSIYSKKYSFYRSVHMIWIAGSLLLAVFITFLAILFIITFSLSVMCNQRKTVNTIHLSTTNSTTENNISSRNEKCKNNMPLLYEPHNRRKFYLNHYNKENCNNELLRILSNNLPNNSFLIDLHNHLSSSSSLHGLLNHHQNEGKQQNNSQQIIITSTTHQQFVDDNSTELSLCMQDDKNEFLRSIDRKIVDNSDVSTTSAIQLLRNWNFYKQRSTSSYGSSIIWKGYAHSNIIASNPNTSNFNDKLEENVMYRCQSRNDTPNLHTISNIRQSLILSINDKNEFILLPLSNSMNPNESNQISSTINNNSSTLGMLNSLSEEDAEATRLEMAASVGALDQQYLQQHNNNDNTLDHLDYTSSSFIRNDDERTTT